MFEQRLDPEHPIGHEEQEELELAIVGMSDLPIHVDIINQKDKVHFNRKPHATHTCFLFLFESDTLIELLHPVSVEKDDQQVEVEIEQTASEGPAEQHGQFKAIIDDHRIKTLLKTFITLCFLHQLH